ncbi:AMP-dependent synthetase/ligase [Sphingomonas dokdonensis]|uniref:Long-chain-fatty-acid--CoA ligase FadD15 n=1 Tax=Sphingomonas dokdonensis TaxID=344880 RepID=A0A245ZVT7_9SPHN|nr:AMP-dependent synthetase/ligase [Sphingomonas dokdonensis]OWK33864.1 long-chain-fatty-acid--CoA ligase FadD15 [Sphingomonas dokdonensis]
MRQLEHFPNLVTMFFTRAREKGDAPFLWAKRGGAWQQTSWAEAARQVASLAAALKSIGLQPGDRVMLISENRPEWCISDLAIMGAGCITVPTYITNTERDHAHIIENSGARAVIVSTQKLADSLLKAVLRTTHIETVIAFDQLRPRPLGVRSCSWAGLIEEHATDPQAIASTATFTRADTACIIYTSGTGGAPRGVMQHHGAILHNIAGCADVISEDLGWGDEVFLSFLPLSHAYEHTGGQMLPIAMGGQIYYAEGLEKLAANMEEVHPTIMFVVPRLFEVLRLRIGKAIAKQGGLSERLLSAALEIGERRAAGTLRLIDRPKALLVDRLFKPRIAQKFGGRMKAMVSGGAPLTPEVGVFFQSLGVTFLQGYGQTEAGPVISCNRPKVGVTVDSVGPPLPHTEVRIAEDGEILVRGELVMHGYWRNPAETARVLHDGWLHTGDIGVIDGVGRIKITDRKKDLIINDKGENVAPQKVEGMLTLQPEIMQAMIAGDRKPHMVAVIVPDPEWTQEFCAARGTKCDFASLAQDADYRAAIGAAVERTNKDLSVTERVRRFILADEPFTIENEQLTPSLKIRRHVLRSVYGDRLEALYKG